MTRVENLANAERWLAKAIEMEDQGKPASLVNRALDKAVEYEDIANGKREAKAA